MTEIPPQLGEEIQALVKHLLYAEGRVTKKLGPGIVCSFLSRPVTEELITFTVFIDQEKWQIGNKSDESGIEHLTLQCRYYDSDGPRWNTISLMGTLRTLLTPRSEDIEFYQRSVSVQIDSVQASLQKPLGN